MSGFFIKCMPVVRLLKAKLRLNFSLHLITVLKKLTCKKYFSSLQVDFGLSYCFGYVMLFLQRIPELLQLLLACKKDD
jgi:hypothetical protein